jgi:hypothetical protein
MPADSATHPVPDAEATSPGRGRRRPGIDAAIIAALTVVLTALFLVPTVLKDLTFPVGPDVPVYLWWARIAAAKGLSVVGERPGTPVLIPSVGAALDIGVVAALAGLQYALGPAIGLAGAALVRGRGAAGRPAWAVAGLFAGVWATHLGDGYVANLAFAAPFLAAAAMLARRTRRGATGAAVLLGGAGLAHPQFFVIGAGILVCTGAWSAWRDRAWRWSSDAGRTLGALVGGAAIVGGGMVAALGGPPHLDGDTSRDAFLRRIGRWDALRHTYLQRFTSNWRHYAPFMTTPLVIMGGLQGRGYARRFLVTWIALTAVTLPFGVVTARFPPDRILTFAFCIPLLAALGFVWLGRRLGRWWIAWPVGIVVWLLMVLAPIRVWSQTSAFVDPQEMRHAITAGRIGSSTPPGTPLVFVVNEPRTRSLFLASHVLNVTRAAVPPDRVDDVFVFVGSVGDLLDGAPSVRDDRLFDVASAISFADIPDRASMAVFVVPEFDRDPADLADPRLTRWHDGVATTVEGPRPISPGDGEPLPVTWQAIVVATVAVLLLVLAVGGGWAWWVTGELAGTVLVAPAFGVATLTSVAVLMERLGVAVGSRPGGVMVAAIAAGGGYGLALLRERERRQQRRGRGLVLEREPHEHA